MENLLKIQFEPLFPTEPITDPNGTWYALHFENIGIGGLPIPRHPVTQKFAAVGLAAAVAWTAWYNFSSSVERPATEPTPIVEKVNER